MKKGCLTVLIIFLAIVFIGGAITLYYLYGKEQEGPLKYRTEQATTSDIVQKTVATGSVIPRKEIEIKPQISGIIQELYVEAGDIVKNGDVIAKVKVIPNMVSLNNAENRLNRAKIALENADMDYNRNKELLDQGVIASAEFQVFELSRKNANEEMQAAEENLQIVRDGTVNAPGKTSNTLIKATIPGMILDVPIEEGNSVIESNTFNEGTTIASVADMDDLVFEGKIDESEVEKLKTGMELILSIGAIETQKFKAILEYISPKGIEENGAIQFDIKAAVQIPDSMFIRAGFSANADVVLDKRIGVLTISESLVQYDREQKPFVEVEVGDQQFERRDVILGLSDGLNVELIDGVSDNDNIKVWNQPLTELPGGKGKRKK